MNNSESDRTVQITKPVNWIVPDSVRTDHATHLVVQQQGSEFTLSFFEVQLPLFLGTMEEQLEALKELPYTDAKCISRIVMSAENITLATNNLIEVMNRFNAMLQATAKGQEDARTSDHTELPTIS